MKAYIYTTLLLFILFSCSSVGKKELGVNNFDVSPVRKKELRVNNFDVSLDGKNIIYSYKKDSLFCLYTRAIDDEKSYLLLSEGDYFEPKYIDQGKEAIALFYPKNSQVVEFHFIDLQKKEVFNKIKFESGYITSFTIPEDDKMYYLKAQVFKNYSPVAPKRLHDFDIYELNLKTLQSRKLSNKNSYHMGDILSLDKDRLLISIMAGKGKSGLFIFNKNVDEKNFERIDIINDTLRKSDWYSLPTILPNKNILCNNLRDMVQLDLKTKLENVILPNDGDSYINIKQSSNTIFYKKDDWTNNIYFFNLNNRQKIDTIDLTP